MNAFKKYTTSFETTKQLTKERLGKASNSIDSEEVKSLKEKLHLIKWALKNGKCSGEEYTLDTEKAAERGTSLAEIMRTMGNGLLTGTEIGDTLRSTGELIKDMSMNTKACSMNTKSLLVIPMGKFYEEDMKQVIDLKRKQGIARLKYEAAQTKVRDMKSKDPKKVLGAEEEQRNAQCLYEELTKQLITECDVVVEKMGRALLPQIKSFVSFHANFYAQAAEQWKALDHCLANGASAAATNDM